jgi:hypothetical protein
MSDRTLLASTTAFQGDRRLARGRLLEVARTVKRAIDRSEDGPILVFDDATGRVVDLDLRGTADDVVARLASEQPDAEAPAGRRGRGRPRLGVVSREVTLLPRHWTWLRAQRGGASATLRRLVDEARKQPEAGYRFRQAQDAAYRFMSAMAGNEAGFEEAIRALYAGDPDRFEAETREWPRDVRDHARSLADEAFAQAPGTDD